ncbi:CPBP family intramembrane metalloprotease [Flavobacterium sp. J372]|uniref:CPBP family intramembrane glutamic endopeptidase n=1 Tax=Flavobacterium sp. J372 TaxID=2898436 RepID=UPI0021514DDA|nr:CPBP family intramembrane glutamic endopeptidase [Flavobacterium sp. J372]MCR5863641.1 CPBP family intramembrane metalloprotease [Flavobacterium sp. J372]
MVLVAEETESEFKRNTDYTEAIVAIGAILVMPVVEEFIFRYFLRYDRINPKLISLKKWNAVFPWLVYFSAITFGAIHLFNFSFSSNSWLLLPALVVPQFITGLVITFLRVRLNFYYGILYHMLWNFSFFMVIPFLVDLIPE